MKGEGLLNYAVAMAVYAAFMTAEAVNAAGVLCCDDRTVCGRQHSTRRRSGVSCSFASRLELSYPHVSIGKARNDVKLPSHRFDVTAKRADVHVRALLDL